MNMLYLKSAHVSLAVIWIAGLLALLIFRNRPDDDGQAMLRWNAFASIPAMIGALATGILLTASAGWFYSGQFWLVAKLFLAIGLVAAHGFQSGVLQRTAASENAVLGSSLPSRLLWIVTISTIIFLAQAKPF